MKKVIVIAGPTGSGKTSLALKIAQKYQLEIISGDSVQVYKGLDIGSAKIKKSEQEGIKHHLIDIREITDQYSAFDFQKDVREILKNLDLAIIAGGTGYYIKSALYDYQFTPFKKNLELAYENLTDIELKEVLRELDPNLNIDFKNRRRVIKAIELAKNNDPRSKKQNKDIALYDIFVIYLNIEREALKVILENRLEKMIQNGFLDECHDLYNKNIRLNVIGYAEGFDYFKGLIDLKEMQEKIISKSLKLAKRQKTWFKNQMDCYFLNVDDDLLENAYRKIDFFIGDKK